MIDYVCPAWNGPGHPQKGDGPVTIAFGLLPKGPAKSGLSGHEEENTPITGEQIGHPCGILSLTNPVPGGSVL